MKHQHQRTHLFPRLVASCAVVAGLAACGDDATPLFPAADVGAADTTDGDATGTDATGTDATGSDTTGTDVTDGDATGSDATGSDATGSDATGSDAGDASDDTSPTDATTDATISRYAVAGTLPAPDQNLWIELRDADRARIEELHVDASGAFAFAADLEDGAEYSVAVTGHPLGRFCTVAPTEGTVSGAPVDLSITCEAGAAFQTEYTSYYRGFSYLDSLSTEGDNTRILSFGTSFYGADGEPWTDDDDVYGEDQLLTPDGDQLEQVIFDSAGPDNAPFTADDTISQYTRFEHNERGDELTRIVMTGPGPDGDWFTDDDVASNEKRRSTWVYDDQGRVVCTATREAGSDGEFNTDDDDTYGKETTYEVAPQLGDDVFTWADTSINGFGADELPCTDDDSWSSPNRVRASNADGSVTFFDGLSANYQETRRNADGQPILTIQWQRVGTGMSGPDVDVVSSYVETLFDLPDASEGREVSAYNAGDDGVWFTEDDLRGRSDDVILVDEDGNIIVSATYQNGLNELRGPDLIWGTNDDVAFRFSSRWEGPTGDSCLVNRSDSGPDGLWDELTGCEDPVQDDTIRQIRAEQVDEFGRMIQWCRSLAAGADGLWTTADDRIDENRGTCGLREWITDQHFVSSFIEGPGRDGVLFTEDDAYHGFEIEQQDDNGFQIMVAEPSGPGVDGVWSTGDDELAHYTTFLRDRAGNLLGETRYIDAGTDGLWYTDDDEVGEFSTSKWGPESRLGLVR